MSSKRLVQKLRNRLVPALFVALTAWCAGGNLGAQQGQAGADAKAVLLAGNGGARWVDDMCPRQAAVNVVVAATVATPNSKKLVTHGTVTMTPDNATPYQYDPQPADKLVLKQPGKTPVEFYVATITGDFEDYGKDFLLRPHTLKYRVVVQNEMELEVVSTKVATGAFTKRYEEKLQGWIVYAGKQYKVDLTKAGTSYFESGFGGFENRDDHTIKGTIAGPDMKLTVAETVHFTGISDGKDEVSYDWRKFGNQLTAGGKSYQWQDVLLKKTFKGGKISAAGCACEGRVLVDGQPFATYDKKSMNGQLIYLIEAPGGAIEIGRW